MENAPRSEVVLTSWSEFPIHREEWMLDSDVHYLNHGAFGATPYPVFAEYQRWQKHLESNPSQFFLEELESELDHARTRLSTFLGTMPENLAMLTNCTLAMNIIARSISLHPGDEVLLTSHEYGAIEKIWRFHAEQCGASLRIIDLPEPWGNEQELLEHFTSALSPRTTIFVFDHVTSSSSLVLPARELCQICRERGIVSVVDGAHAPGQLALNLETVGADYYCGNLHKWLSAAKGSAFLYVHPSRQVHIEPVIVGWAWSPGQPPRRFSDLLEVQGTRDPAALLAIPAAITFRESLPWDHLSQICRQALKEMEPLALAITGQPSLYRYATSSLQMLSLLLPKDIDAQGLRRRLSRQHRVEVAAAQLPRGSALRVSLQIYNSSSDLQAFLEALRSEVGR